MRRVGEKLNALAIAAHRELGELLLILPRDQASRGALLYELIALAKYAATEMDNMAKMDRQMDQPHGTTQELQADLDVLKRQVKLLNYTIWELQHLGSSMFDALLAIAAIAERDSPVRSIAHNAIEEYRLISNKRVGAGVTVSNTDVPVDWAQD